MSPLTLILLYLLALNLLTLALFWWDKRCAIERRWRVPESTFCLEDGNATLTAAQNAALDDEEEADEDDVEFTHAEDEAYALAQA